MADLDPHVEQVLQLVVQAGARLHLAVSEAAFRAMSARGVTILKPDAPAIWDEPMIDAIEQERTPVEIDARRVLEEGVAPWGYAVTREGEDALRLTHAKLPPTKASIIFPLKAGTSGLELRARFSSPLIVRIHCGDAPSPAQRAVERTLGVVPVRLRDLGAVEVDALLAASATTSVAMAAFGLPPVLASTSALAEADPARVVEYANTADAAKFESATAQILDEMNDVVLPLGSRLTGKPVPDGLLVLEGPKGGTQCALYDCKSKEDAEKYSFAPKDGDQFARYDEILRRCEQSGLPAAGMLVATSDADATKLDEKMTKDIWSRLKNRRLIILPATGLLRWHQLSTGEGPAFRGRVDTGAGWDALWNQRLPGIPEERFATYFARRDLPYRVLTVMEAEVIWLAAVSPVKPVVANAFAHLQSASTGDRIEPHKKAHIIDRVIGLLGTKRGIEVDDIAGETGLSKLAVEFLIEGGAFGDIAPDDIGEHFVGNRNTIKRKLLGLP